MVKLENILVLSWGSGHGFPEVIKKLSLINTLQRKKIISFLWWSLTGHISHTSGQTSYLTVDASPKQIQQYFSRHFVSYCLFLYIFCLIGFSHTFFTKRHTVVSYCHFLHQFFCTKARSFFVSNNTHTYTGIHNAKMSNLFKKETGNTQNLILKPNSSCDNQTRGELPQKRLVFHSF